jgi:hypothetical protein
VQDLKIKYKNEERKKERDVHEKYTFNFMNYSMIA